MLFRSQSWPRHKPQAPLPCSATWSKVRVQGRRLSQGGTGPTWESEPRWDVKHGVWVQLQGLRQTLLPLRPPSVLCPETGWSPRTSQQPRAEGGRRQASPKGSVVSRTPLRACGHLAPGSSLSCTGCVLSPPCLACNLPAHSGSPDALSSPGGALPQPGPSPPR